MTSEKTWHAVYTRPGLEAKVAALLTRKNVENYCPLNKVISTKISFQPLFHTYVFVRICEADQRSIRAIKGILNFVYWLGKPALISDEDIHALKVFLAEYPAVKIEKLPDWKNTSERIRLPSLHTTITANTYKQETPIVHFVSAAAQIRI